MNSPPLKVQNISYQYSSYQALHETSFTVNHGGIITITGSNGAGKTTLLKCLSGLLIPTNGTVLIDGYNLYQRELSAKKRLSFLSDYPRYYQELTAWEHIRFVAQAHNAELGYEKRAEALLGEFDLLNAKDVYPHALSRGMRLKLGIILCLIRPFSVLLMDEPTSTLDPPGTDVLREKLSNLSSEGKAIVITTHDLSLARTLGGKTVLMQGGHFEVS